ncbi:MAG: sensor histidine kinase [Bacteroidota bacterium]|nr:sensor histidine kinase [Bacteroidota bacterium]
MKKIFLLLSLILSINISSADELNLEVNLRKGKLLAKQSKNEEALKIFEAGIIQSVRENNLLFEAKYYLEAADMLLFFNRIDSIDSYYTKASKIFEKFKLKPESIRAKVGMLELPRRTNPSATMDQYLALLNEARNLPDRDVYYLVLDKVIIVNYAMENYKEAISLAHECIGYYKSKNDSLSLAMKYRYLGNLYRNSHPDSSLYYYKMVLPYFYKLQAHQLIVYTLVSLGWALYETELNTAWEYLMQADSIDRKHKLKSTQLPLVISFALAKKGKTNEAIKRAKESLQLGMNAKQLFIGIQSADALKEYYKSLKEIDSALHYAELSAIINDSIRSQKQYKDAGRMQAKMEYDKELFQTELRQQEEMKREKLIINYSLLAIGLLLIIVFLIYRAYLIYKKTSFIISKQNDEKTMLLKEIHHRVKNNLSVVSGILDLQQREIKDERMQEIFKDAKSRITSIALVHKNLYEHENFDHFSVQQYFENLYKTIFNTYKGKSVTIQEKLDFDDVEMNVDTLIPFSLIVNELLSNSFKYAFINKSQGFIEMKLVKEKNVFIFIYRDDGTGIVENPNSKMEGLGSLLIKGLCKQLDGKVEKVNSSNGLKYIFTFGGIYFKN